MKIGIFGDLHGENPKDIIEDFNYKKVDLILANGDFISCKNKDLEGILENIVSNANAMVVTIPGNYEEVNSWEKSMKRLQAEYENIIDNHKKKFKFKNYNIVSYGGGTIRPSCMDDIFYIDPMSDIKMLIPLFNEKNIIFQLHEPPKYYGDIACFYRTKQYIIPASCKDKNSIKRNVGNEWLTYLIEGEFADVIKSFSIPRLVTAGHIHESIDTKEIKTRKQTSNAYNLFINPGAAMNGKYAIVEINDSNTSAELLSL